MQDEASDADQAEQSIFGDSQPENSAPQVVTASEHTQHPFFAGGRGRGRGGSARGRGGSRGARGGGSVGAVPAAAADLPATATSNTSLIVPDSEERPLFGPISLRELEFAQRRNTDGAESAVWSEDDDESGYRTKKKKKRKPRTAEDCDTGNRRPRVDATDEEAMATATFGGGCEEEDDDEDDDDGEECDEESEKRSEAVESSVAEGARLLPIRGETCVGCVCDRSVIDTVDRFVRQNAVCMTETALYKAAALHYRNEIVIPRRREGVRVLPWNWKDIQVRTDHFPHVFRTACECGLTLFPRGARAGTLRVALLRSAAPTRGGRALSWSRSRRSGAAADAPQLGRYEAVGPQGRRVAAQNYSDARQAARRARRVAHAAAPGARLGGRWTLRPFITVWRLM